MSIAMAEVVRIDTLDQIIHVYENAEKLYGNKSINETVREYLYTLPILDNCPKGLPNMEDVIADYERGEKYAEEDIILCAARLSDLYSSPWYNRIRELRYGNQKRHLDDNGGYSYEAADTLSGFYRPQQKKAVTTKGNNRASMLYAVTRDGEIRIPFMMKLHPRNRSIEDCIKHESNNHNMDANYRTNQSGDHKFMSAYYAGEPWALDLYAFCKKFNISIAGTLKGAKFQCPSHSYISKARGKKGVNDAYVERFLRAYTSRNCSREIQGNTIISGSLFLQYFDTYIADVDERNQDVSTGQGSDSFADAIDFYFNKWENSIKQHLPSAKNINQEMITSGNSDYKKHEPMVARWVCLYNKYCDRLETSARQNTAIPLESNRDVKNRWNKFLTDSNALVRGSLEDIAKSGLTFM